MPLDNQQNEAISRVGSQILECLDEIAKKARKTLTATVTVPPSNVFARTRNPMVGDASPERIIAAIHYQAREQLARLEREPFIGRVVVRYEDAEPSHEETIYIARG